MKKYILLLFSLLSIVLITVSCSKDDDDDLDETSPIIGEWIFHKTENSSNSGDNYKSTFESILTFSKSGEYKRYDFEILEFEYTSHAQRFYDQNKGHLSELDCKIKDRNVTLIYVYDLGTYTFNKKKGEVSISRTSAYHDTDSEEITKSVSFENDNSMMSIFGNSYKRQW